MPDSQHNTMAPGAHPADHPAWAESELASPHQNAQKADKVRRMFAAIAGKYDLNNRLHSFGRDQAWRRAAVKAAAVRPGETVIDVACGTGDLTELFARSPAARVIGIDFTPEMLVVARRKLAGRAAAIQSKVEYREGDAQALDLPDASAEIVSIAFGIRNVADPTRAIREFARILRPGGRLVIMEFDTPRFPPFRVLNNFYSGWLMPRTATLIAGDRSGAYKYLPRSVGSFMPRAELLGSMAAAGLQMPSARPLTMGICTLYRAEKV